MSKRFLTRFVLNIIISAFAVCLIEGLLIFNMGRLIGVIMGLSETEAGAVAYSPAAVFLYIILAVILFALIFYLLERPAISYIRRLSEGINAVASGDLESRIEVIGDDEFSEMAENINHMTDELRELLRSEREAEQSKNDLITNIAHDLKTPLTSIIGYLELLSGGKVELSPDMEKKYLKIAYNKSKRLEQLIADLFSFTKLSYGRITMKVGYVDIVKLLSQLLEEFYPNFSEAGLSYELRSNVDSLEIAADGSLIARVFENLIGNAIKYGAEGKKVIVRVSAEPQNDAVEVKVINFGYVIPEKDLPQIFEKFYRVDQARSTKTGGTGLGLAIAKEIVEMHGGSITASSDLSGTVFCVRLKIHFNKELENFKRA
ncbi:MAG TPA: HAMP domain-containing histidine kinase [Candidatus Avilachnospira avistercoris]|nr:HAMP domain-containing histidine kinase [Candidatus Avilachnospira avistercoris]